jgi:hypothetical protein
MMPAMRERSELLQPLRADAAALLALLAADPEVREQQQWPGRGWHDAAAAASPSAARMCSHYLQYPLLVLSLRVADVAPPGGLPLLPADSCKHWLV